MTTDSENSSPRKPRIWLRLLLALGILLVGLVVVLLVTNAMIGAGGRSKMADLVARLDAEDPSWRWDQINAERPMPTNVENAALVMQAALKAQVPWAKDDLQMSDGKGLLEEVTSNQLLDEERQKKLQAALGKQKAVLAVAVSLRNFPKGRIPVELAPDVISTLLPHIQQCRDVVHLLDLDAERLCLENRPAEVAERIEAILRTGDILRDEPFMVSGMVRIAIRSIAARRVERLLGLTEPPDAVCDRLRKEIAAQRQDNLLLVVLRGERASVHQLMNTLRSGGLSPGAVVAGAAGRPTPGSLGLSLASWLYGGRMDEDQASALEWMTRACDVARLPPSEQPLAWKEYDRDLAEFITKSKSSLRNLLTVQLMPSAGKTAEAALRDRAYLGCLEMALAAEQYRLRHGHWPKSLADLGPDLAKEVPDDPFTGKKLLYRTDNEGCIVYSTGQDGVDDAARKLSLRQDPGTDLGVRVWNPKLRRLPGR
ncbi:MAG: hypothetical protein U0840_16140 [Gemmataceae bacterium]